MDTNELRSSVISVASEIGLDPAVLQVRNEYSQLGVGAELPDGNYSVVIKSSDPNDIRSAVIALKEWKFA